MNELEKEGLGEVVRWRPLSEKWSDAAAQGIEYDSFVNPPLLRYVNGDKVPTLEQYRIWDLLREQSKHEERVAQINASMERERKLREEDPLGLAPVFHDYDFAVSYGAARDRIVYALAYLDKQRRAHKRYCDARAEGYCKCGATQHNRLVTTMKALLEGTIGNKATDEQVRDGNAEGLSGSGGAQEP